MSLYHGTNRVGVNIDRSRIRSNLKVRSDTRIQAMKSSRIQQYSLLRRGTIRTFDGTLAMLLQTSAVVLDRVAVVLRLKPGLVAPSSWNAPSSFTWSLLPLPHLKLQPLTFVYTHNQISTIKSTSWQAALEDKYFLPSASSPCLFHLSTHICQLTRNQAGAAHHYQRQPSPIKTSSFGPLPEPKPLTASAFAIHT